jgi:glucose dehydrogenase
MEWNGPAYDPGSNSLFVPAVDWCGVFSKAPKDPPVMQGMHYYGGAVASDPREKSKGWLTAFDASTGKERWKYRSPTPLSCHRDQGLFTATSTTISSRSMPRPATCSTASTRAAASAAA